MRINPDKALMYADQGLKLATGMKFDKALARLNNAKGGAYRSKNDFNNALKYFLKAAE